MFTKSGRPPPDWHFLKHMVKASVWKCNICLAQISGHQAAKEHASTHLDLEGQGQRSPSQLGPNELNIEKASPNKVNGYYGPPVDKEIPFVQVKINDELSVREVWPCEHCDTVWASRPLLQQHMVEKHITKESAVCAICGAEVEENETLFDHLEQHLTMKCPLCNVDDLGSFSDLKQHVINEHSPLNICTICGTMFESAESFAYHIVCHQKLKDSRKCPVCLHYSTVPRKDAKCITPSYVMSLHFPKHMVTRACFKCGICMKRYNKYPAAKEHILLAHKPPRSKHRPRVTSVKGRRVSSENGSASKLVKSDDKTSSEICSTDKVNGCYQESVDKEITSPPEKVENNDNMTSEEVWPCPECKTECESRPLLKQHMIDSHITQENNKCVICGERVEWNVTIYDHLKQHLRIKCPLCQIEGIASLFKLKMHISASHPDENKCVLCDDSDETISDLGEHIVTQHSRNKLKWRCPMCPRYHTLPGKLGQVPLARQHFVKHMVTQKCWRCDICEQHLSTHASAKDHMTLIHMPPRNSGRNFRPKRKYQEVLSGTEMGSEMQTGARSLGCVRCEKCQGKLQNCTGCYFSTKSITKRRKLRNLCKRFCEKDVRIVLKRVEFNCLRCKASLTVNSDGSLMCGKCNSTSQRVSNEIQQTYPDLMHNPSV